MVDAHAWCSAMWGAVIKLQLANLRRRVNVIDGGLAVPCQEFFQSVVYTSTLRVVLNLKNRSKQAALKPIHLWQKKKERV